MFAVCLELSRRLEDKTGRQEKIPAHADQILHVGRKYCAFGKFAESISVACLSGIEARPAVQACDFFKRVTKTAFSGGNVSSELRNPFLLPCPDQHEFVPIAEQKAFLHLRFPASEANNLRKKPLCQ